MTDELKKLQDTELSLLKKFQKICEQYEIPYFAMRGTLLGAVRHQGFIPWDDDIDVGIPRPDYDRFCRVMEEISLGQGLSFHTFHNDDTYIRYFAHLEDSSVQVIRQDKKTEEKTNAWIDIFPLDVMPNQWLPCKVKTFFCLALRAIYRLSCFDTLVDISKANRPLIKRVLIWFGLHFPLFKHLDTRKWLQRLENFMTRIPYDSSKYLVNIMGANRFKEMFPKDIYGCGRLYPFEDTEIYGPIDYDTVCRQLYGDYMKLPDEKDRNYHKLVSV